MRRTLRMNLGGEMPMNTTPMSSQDSAALGNMSNTMLSMQSAPTASAAPTAPTSTRKVGAADYSLPGNTFTPMAVPQLRDGGDLGTTIGEYWSGDNARFEAGNPGMMARVGRSLNPMTGLGSAVGAMHDGASKGSFRDMGVAAAQAVPAFAAVKTAKTIAGPAVMADGARTAKHVAAVSAGSAGVDKAQAAGLRNGGDLKTGHGGKVPGEGKGDKVKALYEPGEFVVSNDMLNAQPELREQLHSLRGNVLASQGKSVQQADAEALGGKTLRAQSGATPMFPADRKEKDIYAGLGKPASAPENTMPPGGMFGGSTMPLKTPGVQDGQHGQVVSGDAAQRAGAAPSSDSLRATVGGQRSSNQGGLLSPTGGIFPGSRAVGRGYVDDISSAMREPTVTARVGQSLRATGRAMMAAPLGLAEDILEPATRLLQPVTTGIANTAATTVTGDSAPLFSAPNPTAAPAATAQPTPKAVAAPTQTATPVAPTPTLRDEGVTHADRLQSDALVNKAFSRDTKRGGEFNMNDGINTLRSSPTDMATANKAWAMAGRGIQASYDSKGGLVLSNSTGPEKMRYVGQDGKPTNNYEATEQFANGQTQLAAARASLRNPDGSTWSAQDNATMAANLRDGVSTYQGTSRQPALDAEANAPKRGEFGYKNYMANKQKDADRAVTERGQQLEMERARMTAQASLRKNQFDMQRDIRKDGREQAAHDEAMGEKSREATAKEFMVYDTDKDGRQVANPKASAESLDALRSILPGMTSTDPKTREAALSDAKAMHGIFLKARNQNPVGWEAMKFWKPQRPELSGMPDATGGSIEQLSGFSGAMTVNAKNGDTLLRQKDGREINLGQLDARQRKLLEDAQQRGWGK